MHRIDRLLDELRSDCRRWSYLMPGGKRLAQLRHRLADGLRGRERVRARALEDRDRDRRIAVEIGVRRVVERRQARRAPTSFSRTTAFGVCLTTMLPNSLGIGEPAERLHRDLEGARLVDRRLVEHAGGDLDVLRLQRLR